MKLIVLIIVYINALQVDSANLLSGTRIVGGQPASIQDYPYQLCIVVKQREDSNTANFKGAAVIVSLKWAVTAAQCIEAVNSKSFATGMVYLRGNTTFWKNNYVDHKVVQKQIHPRYNAQTIDYDIGLLKVNKPFTSRFEKPIVIAGKNYELPIDAQVNVSGWGTITNEHSVPENRLRTVDLKIVDSEDCKDAYLFTTDASVTNRMICAWNSGKDSCVYDSGGPMVHNNVLIGVISWGARCGSAVFPGVYVKISEFYSWIRGYDI